MTDADSPALLAAYVGGTQAAFAELVRRHVDLVYSTALRRVGGDAHLARDVVQLVFIDLAVKAHRLPAGVVLGGWLHHHTCFRAATLVRSEQRRRAREEKAATMHALEKQSSDTWTQLAPHLDEALERLATRDRDLIVLRYFEGRTLADVGRSWGLSEDAAQKAVSRALEKLRGHFLKRNLTTATGALAAALAANSVQAAPAGLGATTAQFALAGATAAKAAAPGTLFLTTLLMTTKTKIAIVLTAGAAGIALLVSTRWENVRLRNELATARQTAIAAQAGSAARNAKPVSGIARAGSGDPATGSLLPSEDVEAMLARLIESRVWRKDGRAFDQALRTIAPGDMPRALAFVAQNATGESRSHLTFALVERWTRTAPAAAAAWLKTLPNNEQKHRFRSVVAQGWAEQDPQAALQALGPSPGIIDALAQRSPADAAHRALEVPASENRRAALQIAARHWFEQDPEAAVKWINTLTEAGERSAALEAVISQLAETTPQEVASYIASLSGDAQFLQVGRSFAEHWARDQPSAAAAWAAALPETSALREQALLAVTHCWARDNPKAAAAWLGTLPGSAREQAIEGFVRGAAAYEPQLAAHWALTLPRENSRYDAIEAVAGQWLNHDATAARAWLARTNLPEERKQKLLATR